MKNKILAIMVATMTAVNSLACMAADFTDIKDVPFNGAEVYINKAADLGLMVGEQNALGQQIFRSRDQVSSCEALQLVYNILKRTNNLLTFDTSKWVNEMQTCNIPSWAYDAIAYAVDNNIITINDLSMFVQKDGTNQYATREYIATVFGKALSVKNSVNTNAALSYNDASSIDFQSVPYVDLLSRLNIVLGDENNNFNPDDLINRAQMAVIATKSYESLNTIQVTEQTSAIGTVIDNESFGQSNILTVNVNGESKTLVATSLVSVVYNATQYNLSGITTGDIIQFEYENSLIKNINIIYAATEKKSIYELTGEITGLTTLTMRIDTNASNETVYNFASDAIVDLNGNRMNIDDLIDEFYDSDYITATITLSSSNEITYVDAISENEYKDKIEGQLDYISSSKLSVDDSDYYKLSGEQDLDIEISDGTEEDMITDIDELVDAFDDEKVIEAVVYLDEDEYVIGIEGEVVEVVGELYSIDIDDDTITIDGYRGYSTYQYDEDELIIDITDGTEEDTITDIDQLIEAFDDDKIINITVYIEDGYVVEIEGEVEEVTAELDAIDIDDYTITVEAYSGYFTYEYDEDVYIEIDGDSIDVDELEETFEDEDIQVKLTIVDGYITQIIAQII